MTSERIEELIGLLPERSPYVTRIPRIQHKAMGVPEEVDVRSYAMNDASFGWKFINSFLDLGRPVPADVYESVLLRPYCYVRYESYDRDARMAFEIENIANRTKRALLRCMLLVSEMPYRTIAESLQLTVETVKIYENLFWNIRDRLPDPAYLTQLIFPDTRKVELMPNYLIEEDPQNLVLRITIQHGLKVMEELLGIRNPISEFDSQSQAKSYEAQIMSAGNFVAKIGFLHQQAAYAISSARHVLQSIKLGGEDQVDDDARRGLEGMSMGRSLTETFMEIAGPDIKRQLMMQNQAAAA